MHRPFLCSACLIQSLNALPMKIVSTEDYVAKLHAALLSSGGDVRRSTEVELWVELWVAVGVFAATST